MAAAQPLAIGQLVLGRYRIAQEIGRGGFARVYRASVLDADTEVAIKLLLPLGKFRPSDVSRFEREAQLVQRLDHPGVVRLHDFGHVSPQQPVLVFELLRGKSLAEMLQSDGPMAPPRVARMAIQVLEALRAAHELGIVHRDVKPENIVLSPAEEGERARVIDFGIAKALWGEGADMTQLTATGLVLGSPFYMAPEQARGEDVGPGADLYSLGLVLAEALTGQSVVQADTPMDALMAQLESDSLPLDRQVLTSPLGPVVARAAQKPVEVRYRDAAQMLSDLRAVMERVDAPGPDATPSAPSGELGEGAGTAFAPTALPAGDPDVPPPATSSARSTAEQRYVEHVASGSSPGGSSPGAEAVRAEPVRVQVGGTQLPDPFGPTAAIPSPAQAATPSALGSTPGQRAPEGVSGSTMPAAGSGFGVASAAPAPPSPPAPLPGPSWPSTPPAAAHPAPSSLRKQRWPMLIVVVLSGLLVVLVLAVILAWAGLRERARDAAKDRAPWEAPTGPADGSTPGADSPRSGARGGVLARMTERQLRSRLRREGWQVNEQSSRTQQTDNTYLVFLSCSNPSMKPTDPSSRAQVNLMRMYNEDAARQSEQAMKQSPQIAVRRDGRTLLFVAIARDPVRANRLADALIR